MMNNIMNSSFSSSPVDLSDLFLALTTDLVCRTAFGRKYNASENHGKLKDLLGEFLELLGTFTFGDFIPWLAWVDHVNGLNGRVNRVAKELNEFLEEVVEERMAELERRGIDESKAAFVDILLRIQKDNSIGFSLDRDNIKALLLVTLSLRHNPSKYFHFILGIGLISDQIHVFVGCIFCWN